GVGGHRIRRRQGLHHHGRAYRRLDGFAVAAGNQQGNQRQGYDKGQGMTEHDGRPFAKGAWNTYTARYSKNSKLTSPVLKGQMSDKLLQPSSGPGRPKDPAKRQAILEAAKSLFMQNGYDGSSMDAIAAE